MKNKLYLLLVIVNSSLSFGQLPQKTSIQILTEIKEKYKKIITYKEKSQSRIILSSNGIEAINIEFSEFYFDTSQKSIKLNQTAFVESIRSIKNIVSDTTFSQIVYKNEEVNRYVEGESSKLEKEVFLKIQNVVFLHSIYFYFQRIYQTFL